MSGFLAIAAQHAVADAAFQAAEQAAFDADDDAAFDQAVSARQRNDQAYFLYLFTRDEAAVNSAIDTLLVARTAATMAWTEARIWRAWSRVDTGDIALLAKVELLTDKGRADYARTKQYYDGRNTIAHGGDWSAQFFLQAVAQEMDGMVARFVTA